MINSINVLHLDRYHFKHQRFDSVIIEISILYKRARQNEIILKFTQKTC